MIKKIFAYLLLFAIVSNVGFAFAQNKVKEGKAVFTFSYPDQEKISEKVFSNLEIKSCTYYFKNGLTRVEYDDNNHSTYLIDPKKKEWILLKDKLALIHTFEDILKSESFVYGDTIAQITGETKMIAGFRCVKGLYTYPVWQKSPRTIEIWFTHDISAMNNDFNFKGIDGFIMEYSMVDVVFDNIEEVDFKKEMTCAIVEMESVPDDLFKIPSDFTVMTWDEFKEGAKFENH
jgi:GLPGLI family protein